jgi:hypothetical protein
MSYIEMFMALMAFCVLTLFYGVCDRIKRMEQILARWDGGDFPDTVVVDQDDEAQGSRL